MANNKKFDISIMPTFILLIIFGIGFWLGAKNINEITVENSLNVLSNSAAQFATEIERTIEGDKNRLDALADILAECDDITSEEAIRVLAGVSVEDSFSELRVSTPEDDVYVYADGEYRIEEATLDFEDEVAKGNYVSNIMSAASGNRYLYQTVPIEKNGEVKGVLYGVFALNSLPEQFYSEAFNETAQIFVLDGATGEFVFSSWGGSENLYNIKPTDVSLDEKYDYDLWIRNLKEGNEDCIAVWSEDRKEYYYTAAIPLKINEWRVLIAVPEHVVFERISGIRCIFRDMVILTGILLVIYLTWVVILVRKEVEKNNRRIETTEYMYEVQKLLFDSRKGTDSIIDGLRKAGEMLTASLTFVCSVENMKIEEIYQWSDVDSEEGAIDYEKGLRELYGITRERLKLGESILCDLRDKSSEMEEWNFEAMKRDGVSNVMIVPIFDSEGSMIGALGAFNTKKHWHEADLLECTSWNFMMALSNIKSYRIIRRMGTIDAITGLKNRNCYEERLKRYAKEDARDLSCIYMDANGLHELNNTLGHAAGDEMLRSIAEAIIHLFNSETAYRVGGDEFVVFCKNVPEEVILEKLSKMKEMLVAKDYHVSVGMVKCDKEQDISTLVSEAEKKMYEAKKQYYKENAHVDRRCR